ncbi:MAG: sensor histidine kinase [Anaerolineae bacterium]|nr:sensor histidine kinase [Anaerolineae bacterium]MDW8170851.1 sensor histidine kinase [Anaerolineae bacterium]
MKIRWRDTSILTRLLLGFLVIGLLPLGINTLITFNSWQNALQSEVEAKLRAIADGKISQIETYALERARDVVALSRIPTIIEATLRFSDILQTADSDSEAYKDVDRSIRSLMNLILDGSGYDNLMLFSADGVLLFSVLPMANVGQNYIQMHFGNPLAQTLVNARTLLETEISRLVMDGEQTYSFISAPIFLEGEVAGIVSIQLKGSDLIEVINDRAGLSLGETGETLVGFVQDGEALFSSPSSTQPGFSPLAGLNENFRNTMNAALRGIQGRGIARDHHNQEVIAVWSYLPSLRWGMMVKIDTREAFGAIAAQRNFVLGLMLLTLVALVAISYTLANSLSRPIQNLVSATETVAQGVYENKIAVQGTGEIRQLVDAFDRLIRNTIAQRTRELEEIARQERENSRLKDDFMAVVSHELRTPLNAIIGFMGIVQQKANLDEKNAYRLARARANAERLLALINDILDISRIESGNMVVFKQPMALGAFFERLHGQMQSLAEEKGLSFTLSLAEDLPPTIYSDEELLTKIFVNLVGNAIKFTDQGFVRITAKREATSWTAIVQDSGPGIPPHMHQAIFERFRQVDSSPTRRHGGTGLGLSIVKSLVLSLNGSIRLESALGEGSSFIVTLPLEMQSDTLK